MPVELMHLMQLATGQKPELQVGDLPRPVADRLGCHPAIVFLRRREFMKIAEKHGMDAMEFLAIPYMIKSSRYYEYANRPDCLTVFGEGLRNGELYQSGLKLTDNGHEVWGELGRSG